jgi:hypothetical protein
MNGIGRHGAIPLSPGTSCFIAEILGILLYPGSRQVRWIMMGDMRAFLFDRNIFDLPRFVFATLVGLFLVLYLGILFPSGQLSDGVGFASASVSATAESVATYGVQGTIPWYTSILPTPRLNGFNGPQAMFYVWRWGPLS